MADSLINTPLSFTPAWVSFDLDTFYSERIDGTFNSVAYNAATVSILNNRYYFNAFADTGNDAAKKVCCQFATKLPNDYKNGTDIKIRPIWTSLATTGNVKWQLGLAKMSSIDVFSNDSDTEYLNFTQAADSDGTNFKAISGNMLTFNGSTLISQENVSIIVTRDGADASDTLSATAYINRLEFYYQRESYEQVTTNSVLMTPTSYKTVYKSIPYYGQFLTGQAATFNSLSTTAATNVVLNDRWRSKGFADAAINAGTFDFALPIDFVAGENIVVEVSGYTPTAGTNSVDLGIGFTKTTPGNVYAVEAAATYQTASVAMVAAFNKITQTFSFSSSGYAARDIIGFVSYRNGTADTFNAAWREIEFAIRYPINSNGVSSVS